MRIKVDEAGIKRLNLIDDNKFLNMEIDKAL